MTKKWFLLMTIVWIPSNVKSQAAVPPRGPGIDPRTLGDAVEDLERAKTIDFGAASGLLDGIIADGVVTSAGNQIWLKIYGRGNTFDLGPKTEHTRLRGPFLADVRATVTSDGGGDPIVSISKDQVFINIHGIGNKVIGNSFRTVVAEAARTAIDNAVSYAVKNRQAIHNYNNPQ